MFRRHYLTGVLVLLSIAAGSAVAKCCRDRDQDSAGQLNTRDCLSL
jgi:hypothetical protein